MAFHSIVRNDESLALVQHRPQPIRPEPESEEPLNLDEVNRKHIQKVLSITKGKVSGLGGAAEKLGIHPATLRNRMIRFGIPIGKGKY